MQKHKAFSLIELSIVIVIIGILVAGTIKGSGLVRKFTIESSQQMTRNSAVGSIKNLYLWLEPVMNESFLESETVDGNKISRWNDINPQTSNTDRYYAVIKSGTSPNITYVENSIIGNRPSILFSPPVSNYVNYLGLSRKNTSNTFTGTTLKTPDNAFTICTVLRATSQSGFPAAFSNGSGYNYWGYGTNGSNRSFSINGTIVSMPSGSFKINVTEILCATYQGASKGDVAIYVNGKLITSSSVIAAELNPGYFLYIGSGGGGNNPWNGYISEFIVYGRALKTSERNEVETYLSKKYNIELEA